MMKNQQGMTIVEALAAVTITGLLLGLAVVSYQTFIDKKRISGASEALYSDIKLAHSESIRTRTNRYVTVKPGSTWCYGVDDTAPCDCSVANDCQVGGITKAISGSDFLGTSVALTGFTAGSGGTSYVMFEGVRGTANATGTVTVSKNGASVLMTTNKMGLVDQCSDTIVTFRKCS